MKYLIVMCALVAGAAASDDIIPLMTDEDVPVESVYQYRDLFMGADVDSVTLKCDGVFTFGLNNCHGLEEVARVLVLTEFFSDYHLYSDAFPEEGDIEYDIVFRGEHIDGIQEVEGLEILFMVNEGGCNVLTWPTIEHHSITMVIHRASGLPAEQSTMGRSRSCSASVGASRGKSPRRCLRDALCSRT